MTSSSNDPIATQLEDPEPLDWYSCFCILCRIVVEMVAQRAVIAPALLTLGTVSGIYYFVPKFGPIAVGIYVILAIFLPLALLVLVAVVSRLVVSNRQAPFDSAKTLLIERIQSGRAVRVAKKYDVFLPKTRSDMIPVGLIFFPGALVDHTVYAPWAARLSDMGILVVIKCLEPCRISTKWTGCDKKTTLNIMYEILSSTTLGDLHSINVKEWALGGHSQGAAAAFELVQDMRPGVSKLVMLGSSSPAEKRGNLAAAPVNVLLVDASNDGLISESDRTKFYPMVPPRDESGRGRTHCFMIKGGNHAGFGHYGPQTFPKLDGERTIPLEEQQRQCATAVADFLTDRIDKSKTE